MPDDADISVDLSPERLRRVTVERYSDEDEGWLDYYNLIVAGPGARALEVTIRLAEAAPDDDALCFVGVAFVEALLDLHWTTIAGDFEREAGRRPSLRKALSCASLDIRPRGKNKGTKVEDNFYRLIGPGENIGGCRERAEPPRGR